MAFFKKLKDRLFKSSSKIEDGLDAIVEDGGVEEIADAENVNGGAADAVAEIEAAQQNAEALSLIHI